MPHICHFEIFATDPERAIAFYSGVFGWQFTKTGGSQDYWLICSGAKPEVGISGGLLRSPTPIPKSSVPAAFVCYILVDSVDAYLPKVAANGGLMVGPKTSVPGYSSFAPCLDSEGNQFRLFEADSR